jgi:hypothetical protein
VGSRSKINLAYIAGFLDGDGSLMLQVKKRSDTKRGVRFMATICLYQDTRHERPLLWMREIFGIGYISRRNDGITELRINGYEKVENILSSLQPFIRFKIKQTNALIKACQILNSKPFRLINDIEMGKIVDLIFVIRKENYATRSKVSREELCKLLGLTP